MQAFLKAISTEGSIRRKIYFGILAAIVLIFPPIMMSLNYTAQQSIENKVGEARVIEMHVDAQAVTKPLYDFDYVNLRRMVSIIAARGEIDRVEVLDAAGGLAAAAPVGARDLSGATLEEVEIFDRSTAGEQKIGTLRIWFNNHAAMLAVQEFHWKSSIAVVSALLVVFLALMVVLRRVLLRPLNVLMSAIERSEEAGGGFLAAWSSSDEMGRLVSHFNAMQVRVNQDAEKLKAAVANFSTLYNKTPAMLFSLDHDCRIVEVSDYWVNETGYSRSEAVGRNFTDFLIAGENRLQSFEESRRNAEKGDGFGRLNCRFRKKDGSVIDGYVAEALAPLCFGERQRTLLVMVDISDLKNAEAQLLQQARTDSLTGLPNRRHFKERLDEDLQEAAVSGGRLSVFFIDLDRFKWINDNLGHQAGDEVLNLCAERITGILPEDAFFARLGGDEFAIVTRGLEDETAALSRSINEALCAPFRICGSAVSISASIGVAAYPSNAENVGDLLRAADLAMYRAKRAGRSGFKNYEDSLGDEARRLFDLEKLMKSGPLGERFYLDFQPIVRLSDQRIIGAEGLLRMRDGEGRIVSPADFIPVAEEVGLMPDLGAFALSCGAKTFGALMKGSGRSDLRLAINLSAVQVTEELPEQVMEILEQAQFPAERLVLEITESVFLKQDGKLLSIFERLKSMGCRLALDDFGTGYSSLSYLNDFPIDIVKIDREFVRRLDGDGGAHPDDDLQRRSRALLQGVAAIAQELKLDTVAEGVETDTQRRLIGEMGFMNGQGYFWSKPVGPDVFAERLQAERVSSLGAA